MKETVFMIMRRLNLLILSLLVVTAGLFASQSDSYVFPVDSQEFSDLMLLHVSQGLALPSTAGPWSSAEMRMMLERIDTSRLSGTEKALYDRLSAAIGSDRQGIRVSPSVAGEVYAHTNTSEFTSSDDWAAGYDERSPFLNLPIDLSFGPSVYGHMGLSLGNNKFESWEFSSGGTGTDRGQVMSPFFGKYYVTTNVPFIPPGTFYHIDMNMPYRAFLSLGGSHWNVQVGREKLSWGAGATGNFILGDHVQYHSMARFAAFNPNFKYTFILSFFPHPNEIESNQNGSQAQAIGQGLKFFMGQRFEWRFNRGRMGLAISENMMYQSDDGSVDLRVINPLMVFHNLFIRSNSNSILSIEFDYTPIPRWNFFAQVALDEFAFFGEPQPGVSDDAYPNAMGYMLGAKTYHPQERGVIWGDAEIAYTTPYLYLRSLDGTSAQTDTADTLNFVIALRRYVKDSAGNNEYVIYEPTYLGYKYGGDAIVAQVRGGYRVPDAWSVSGRFFYMAHGTHDMWTYWPADDIDYNGKTTPTTSSEGNDNETSSGKNAVAHTFIIGASGSYNIIPSLEVYSGIDMVLIKNKGNVASVGLAADLQVSVGMKYTF